MGNPKRQGNEILQFVLWTILFGIAYAQSPLFTSNQNQYFFFGMANSSLPNLQQDWLYSTTDIVPLFSWLVFVTKRIFQTNVVFYLEYFVIFGVYLYATYSITRNVFEKLNRQPEKLIFAFLIVFLHSASLRYVFSTMISPEWEFLIEGGVAGQRLLGDVFQPSTFGVFLLLGIAFFVQKRNLPAILSISFAAMIHPTYLLSAAVLTLTFMIIRWQETRSLKQSLLLGILALFLVTPIVLYISANFLGVDPAINAAGQQIVIEYRQPHHMIIANWLDLRVGIKLAIFIIAMWTVRKHRLFWILLIPGLFVIGMTLIQAVIQSPSLAMLFPWRFSVILIPLSTNLIAGFFIEKFSQKFPALQNRLLYIQWVALIGMMFVGVIGLVKFLQLLDAKIQSPEYALYQQVRLELDEGQLYMIPLKMQDFRLETGAPIVVEYKAAPQSSDGVLTWYERVQEVDHFYSGLPWGEACQRLPELVNRYGITHIIIPLEDLTTQSCLKQINSTDYYGIFLPVFDE